MGHHRPNTFGSFFSVRRSGRIQGLLQGRDRIRAFGFDDPLLLNCDLLLFSGLLDCYCYSMLLLLFVTIIPIPRNGTFRLPLFLHEMKIDRFYVSPPHAFFFPICFVLVVNL